jgi:O-acetyl-ADP-ribose deacetylase (regulator of RNase III)
MITYIKGDATRPIGPGVKLVIHICNTKGGWGSGFVVSLSKRWKSPEIRYRKWFRDGTNFILGEIQMVLVETLEDDGQETWVVNMIAQVGYGRRGASKHPVSLEDEGKPPIRYEALERCLEKVYDQAKKRGASIHSPRLGAGLAGGSWSKIEGILNKVLGDLSITIYDPPGSKFNP